MLLTDSNLAFLRSIAIYFLSSSSKIIFAAIDISNFLLHQFKGTCLPILGWS